MMIEWVLFVVLTLAGLWLAYQHAVVEHEGGFIDQQLFTHALFAMALVSSLDVLVVPAFYQLTSILPHPGALLNQIVAATIIGIPCVAFVVFLPMGVFLLESSRRDRSSASQVASDLIERVKNGRR